MKMSITTEIPDMKLDVKRAILVQYLQAKLQEFDWHAVSDAANDLRVLEAQIEAGNKIQDALGKAFSENAAAHSGVPDPTTGDSGRS